MAANLGPGAHDVRRVRPGRHRHRASPASRTTSSGSSRTATSQAPGRPRGRRRRAVLAEYPKSWSEFALMPERFLDAGDELIVTGVQRGIAQSDGHAVPRQVLQHLDDAAGKVVRFEAFTDTAMMWKAFGEPPARSAPSEQGRRRRRRPGGPPARARPRVAGPRRDARDRPLRRRHRRRPHPLDAVHVRRRPATERAIGIDHWQDECPQIDGVQYSLGSPDGDARDVLLREARRRRRSPSTSG